MAKAELVAVTRSLLALVDALTETRQALLVMTPPEQKEALQHLSASNAAMERCLEQIQSLVALLEDDHG